MASSVKISNANGKIVTIENNDSNMSDVTLNGASITKKVDTLANMRAMNELPETVWCSGYHSKNDGAFGSHFYRLKGLKTTETDNSGTVVIVSVGGSDYVYELQYDGAVNVKWFGAKGDWNGTSGTDDTDAIQSAIDAYTYIEINSMSYITSELIALDNITITGQGGFICDDVATIGQLISFQKSATVSGLTFESLAPSTVVETSVAGDFIRFDYITTVTTIKLNVSDCTFINAKNDAINTGSFTGTGNNVELVEIYENTFKSSGRYDVTVRNANNAIGGRNKSFNAGGFWDSESSGLTNNMENVSVCFNLVSEAAYNAIQVSASESFARGRADISNNVIELNTSYVPTVVPKQPLAVRTNECSITGNTITGRMNRVLDCSSTSVSMSGNTIEFDATSGLEIIRLSNSSTLDAKGNNILALSTMTNGDVNADATSKYSFLNHNSTTMVIGGRYENILKIFGNNGLGSRAKIEIGDLQIDTTGLVGSEFITIRSKASNKVPIQIDNLGRLKLLNVPTVTTGLTTGHIWNDGGLLKII